MCCCPRAVRTTGILRKWSGKLPILTGKIGKAIAAYPPRKLGEVLFFSYLDLI